MKPNDRVITNLGTGTIVASHLSVINTDEDGNIVGSTPILYVELDSGIRVTTNAITTNAIIHFLERTV